MDDTRDETEPPADTSAVSGLRLALVALVAVLIAALGYIIHLRDRLAQLERRPPVAMGAARPAAPAAQVPAAPPPAAQARPAAPAPAPPGKGDDAEASVLTAEQRRAMVDTLKSQAGADRLATFHVQDGNPETAAVQMALARVFEEAGWSTTTVRTGYPVKSGIFLLAADEMPPPFVDAVNEAFAAAGIDAQYLTGYRAFVAERKQSNPNWRGPDLTEAQAFTIVVGSKPTPKPVDF